MSKVILLIISLLYLTISYFPHKTLAAQRQTKPGIVLEIPALFHLKIFGYTSPYSLVEIESIRVYGKTTSKYDGYFEFVSLPISREAQELCLTTLDEEKRVGAPTCVSASQRNNSYEIGPVLLSPTLSLSKNLLWPGEQARASGKTVPDSTVVISFFESDADTFTLVTDKIIALFSPGIAQAKQVPLLTIPADRKGNFSVNLPSTKTSFYRLFSKTIYRESPTPKSITLSFLVGSYWGFWIRFILPKILFILIIAVVIWYLVYNEMQYKTVRSQLYVFNETRLKPFGVKTRLKLRRLRYKYEEFRSSIRK